MSKFFVPPECIKGNQALIVGPEAHHILDVMRLKKGDRIQAFDGAGKLYRGKILDTQARKVKLQIESVRKSPPVANLRITLVQAVPKKNKMDYIVEKCTELGVDSIIPTQTSRTIVKLGRERQGSRKLRWERIAQEAAKQCGRSTIPQIKDLIPWKEILTILNDFDLKLLPCLSEKAQKLKDILRVQKRPRRIAIFIGPEGGFSPQEIRQACDSGCIAVSLSENVLKTDTAAVSALAAVTYELGQ